MVQLIMTRRCALEEHYGAECATRVLSAIEGLKESTTTHVGSCHVLVLDDPQSVLEVAGEKSVPESPADMKALLDQCEVAICPEDERPLHVLVVGGHQIVPFHELPNPSFNRFADTNERVLSDNPYASRDEEYLVPERPVGRLPGARDTDGTTLLQQIAIATRLHRDAATGGGEGFGYSALAWVDASRAVIRQHLASDQDILTSPDATCESFQPAWLSSRRFTYFNLHGVQTGGRFYGDDGKARRPVALEPCQVGSADVSGTVAVCEACFGGYVEGREVGDSIALSYLAGGAICFVGSTDVAYGAAEPPLQQADMVAKYFFEYVDQGATVGTALMKAKIDMATKTIRRAGFLSAEDRKTLIEFVLYGDPSLGGR